jgi:penicillin-binding protein 1C
VKFNFSNKLQNFSLRKKAMLITALLLIICFYFLIPDQLFNKPCSTVLYDKNYKLLNARISADGQWRFPYSESIPEKFKTCITQFEDRYFYYHPGINPVSVFNALIKNLKHKKKKSGGSTITMQVARLARNNPERSYWEKVVELFWAIRIESGYSKNTILNLYACNAPFGGNVVGLHAASWRYFGRAPEKLSWGENALLAVLPNAPSLLFPGKNHHLLLLKRNRLLFKLYQNNIISKETYTLALQEKIPEKALTLPHYSPHLLQRIIKENGEGKIYQSTIRKELQEKVNSLVNEHVNRNKLNQINNACAIVIENNTGNVLAYTGNAENLKKEDHNDVDIITSSRSSGSILKPILYSLLLDQGKISPRSLIEDIPTQIGSYAPKNFNLTFDGMVPANEALARSLNVPAVKMLQSFGTSSFHYYLQKIGFSTITKPPAHYGLSLILGGAEVSPFEVGCVYSSLARELNSFNNTGYYIRNNYRKCNLLSQNEIRDSHSKNGLISAGSLWLMFNAMTELARPEDYSYNSLYSSLGKIAWKTGTSFGFRDAWAVGVNKLYTVVVWLGNADGEGRPGLTGINVAAPLLFSVFNCLDKSWFSRPDINLKEITICEASGFKAGPDCISSIKIKTSLNGNKIPACPYHKTIMLDSSGTYRVNGNCYPVSKMTSRKFFVLPPLHEYFYKKNHINYAIIPPFMSNCINESSENTFDIIYPRNGFRIYLPVNEKGIKNELILNATNTKSNEPLYWYLDGAFISQTSTFHQIKCMPEQGWHSLTVMDKTGRTSEVKFEIIEKEKKISKN